jgi:cellulose biosynthesis protein BcsQ
MVERLKIPSTLPPTRTCARLAKGGGGSSTTAWFLALAAAITAPRQRVLLVDGDSSNGTIWINYRVAKEHPNWPTNLDVARWRPDEYREAMEEINADGDYDHVVLEPTNAVDDIYAALMVVNYFLIPLTPSEDDYDRLKATLNIHEKAVSDRPASMPALGVSIIQSMVHHRSRVAREQRKVIALADYDLFDTQVPENSRYTKKKTPPESIEGVWPYDEALAELIAIERTR